jgi:predicted dehydrogenase
MRIGLLGSDATIADVVAAAVRRGDRITAAFDAGDAPLPGGDGPRLDSWDPLLEASVCDVVLVGGDGWDASRAEAVRTLVQAGRPLLLAQPLELSMLWAYELDMIRRDTGAELIPCLPDRLHPFVARLRTKIETALAGAGGNGAAETLAFERRMRDRSKTAVLAQLARDADLVRTIVGDPAKLSTLGAADPDNAWGTLAVGFTGPALVPVRWQVAPAGDPGLTLRLQCAKGSIVVDVPDDSARPWTWSGDGGESASFDRGAAMLAVLDARLGSGPPAAADQAATWIDAARAIELAETVPRSLARGRAIDLHREEFTELGTFRGTMASLGCGLVLAALLVVILATLVAGVAREFDWGIARAIADAWPVVILTAMGLFLLLQLLPLLIGGDRNGRDEPPAARRRE